MNFSNLSRHYLRGCLILLLAGVTLLAGCGSSSSSSSPPPPPTSVVNTVSVQVNSGPSGDYGANGIFATVTVCVPATSNCQDIPNVLVDTGSEGLRVLSSALTITPTPITDTVGDPLYECVAFADNSFVWGPVGSVDIQMAGEKAASIPIQTIAASPAFAAPASCNTGGPNANTLASLGANGILGIGPFIQDCGSYCTVTPSSLPYPYYLCPATGCQVAAVPLAAQLENPVAFFPQDYNGVLIQLPSVASTGQATASGSMIFGIGTQSDNALGSAQVYTPTDSYGDLSAVYNGVTYSGGSYFDSGSNGLYILDAATLGNGIVECSTDPNAPDYGYYCPASTTALTATNIGLNGTSSPVSFSIANADALFSSNNAAFDDLGGDGTTSFPFDWGLPFFFGRNVFVGIENKSSTGGTGPYWAF